MNGIEQINRLNLCDVQKLLHDKQVLVAPEDDRNLIEIGGALGLIMLIQVEQRDIADEHLDLNKLLMEGKILQSCNGVVRVLQAVERLSNDK